MCNFLICSGNYRPKLSLGNCTTTIDKSMLGFLQACLPIATPLPTFLVLPPTDRPIICSTTTFTDVQKPLVFSRNNTSLPKAVLNPNSLRMPTNGLPLQTSVLTSGIG